MTIEEIKARVKQNLEDGTTEKLCKEAGLTDEQVEECLNVCKKALDGVYGDDIFTPEHNIYLRHLGEIEEIDEEEKKLYFDPEILKQPIPQWMEDIGHINLEIKIERGESKK